MALNLRHQTPAQFAARLRERFRSAERSDAARLAAWIVNRIAAGDITDAQVRNAFGMTTVQYTAFKSRLQTLRDNWTAVNAARGE